MDKKQLTTTRPRNFDEFWKASLQEGLDCEHKYVTKREDWQKALKESKTAENVVDKISADQLPECEDIKSSKVGDFMGREKFEDMYDDEKERLIDNLKDGSMLAYSGADGVTWWKRRKNNDGDGLIRIR